MHNGYDAVDSKNQPLVSQADYLKNFFLHFVVDLILHFLYYELRNSLSEKFGPRE